MYLYVRLRITRILASHFDVSVRQRPCLPGPSYKKLYRNVPDAIVQISSECCVVMQYFVLSIKRQQWRRDRNCESRAITEIGWRALPVMIVVAMPSKDSCRMMSTSNCHRHLHHFVRGRGCEFVSHTWNTIRVTLWKNKMEHMNEYF